MFHGYSKITVLFEAPFWVGIYEMKHGERYKVAKITFGSEPKDYDVYKFLLHNWNKLKFHEVDDIEVCEIKRVNPKRLQKDIGKYYLDGGIGTKAQQALKLQHEERKIAKSTLNKKRKTEKALEKYVLRQQKLKEKRKGH